ncbi:MAG: NAD(P)/FAD-dependent oxidoreductase [Leptolyngbyaceae cyanobacterium RM1_406_9]|nr:NAD(P)/FAD-dependent oxidoreductase [Leptolyngbyaceae cyanobacterium RM1_406_9]
MGGFTQEFQRQNFQWDVGLHYVGEMGKGESGRMISDYITDGKLKWAKIPDPFETSVYPDFTFEVYSDPHRYQTDLIQRFPDEKVGIVRYFADLQRFGRWNGLRQATRFLPGWLGAIAQSCVDYFGKPFLQTTKEYLDQHFRNPQLKALLSSDWGTYGLPPSESLFSIHALVMSSYLKGGWYPVGGAQEIAKQILPVIEQAGGQAIAQRQVTEIIAENGVAIGVKAQKTHDPDAAIETYYAPVVISDAGAFNTYTKLLPVEERARYDEDIQRFPKGHSTLLLFLGLKASPQTLGFGGGHHWVYSDYDHDAAWQLQRHSPEQSINSCYLSFPSLKDPMARSHTAEVMVFADYECFAQWQGQPWRKRDAEYYTLKDRITQNIINFLEQHYTGFKDLIEFADLSTPLTIAYFDASDRGAIYGIPFVPERLKQPWVGVKTPIQNLYLTGADALGPGILGAAWGGIMAAAAVNGGAGFPKIMAAMRQEAAQKQTHIVPVATLTTD